MFPQNIHERKIIVNNEVAKDCLIQYLEMKQSRKSIIIIIIINTRWIFFLGAFLITIIEKYHFKALFLPNGDKATRFLNVFYPIIDEKQ